MGRREMYAAVATALRESYATEMGLKSDTSSENRLEEKSDASSETRLVESDNLIVDTHSGVSLFQNEEEVVVPETQKKVAVIVPETQETVAVIVPETQDTVVGLLSHEVINPCTNADKFMDGGFFTPTLYEGDNHSSYSQFESQFSDPGDYTCFHCGRGMVMQRCPNCTHGVEFSCVHCDVYWLGPENNCTKLSNGNHQWKRKLVDVDDDKVDSALKVARTF
jgi:hypothetical protein